MVNPEPAATVLDRNACRNCRRVIQLLAGVGWVHTELPQYAHEPITCAVPFPSEYRCPVCRTPRPKDQRKRVDHHDHPEGGPCPGSGQPGVAPAAGAS